MFSRLSVIVLKKLYLKMSFSYCSTLFLWLSKWFRWFWNTLYYSELRDFSFYQMPTIKLLFFVFNEIKIKTLDTFFSQFSIRWDGVNSPQYEYKKEVHNQLSVFLFIHLVSSHTPEIDHILVVNLQSKLRTAMVHNEKTSDQTIDRAITESCFFRIWQKSGIPGQWFGINERTYISTPSF